jgi:hypothetical protein
MRKKTNLRWTMFCLMSKKQNDAVLGKKRNPQNDVVLGTALYSSIYRKGTGNFFFFFFFF